ncbi:MAG: AAA-like domain-containing protein [Chitinivibrionia bacterium]|nr:AAA-like domain-containing protein [Chitinivibrionia bacterium]
MRKFNVTGLCVPDLHYMADTSEKIAQIKQFVDQGEYFGINRGRQYGKTTTLFLLEEQLAEKYTVISISFEGVDDEVFETPESFCQGFLGLCANYFTQRKLPGSEVWVDKTVDTFAALDAFLDKACDKTKYVLMIDEVDKTSNNTIFLKFLGVLRDKYLKRPRKVGATFQSVILAGVYDIKNLKVKMVQAGTHQLQDGEKRINSPWNIAINFNVDMSLSVKEIASMLTEYEKDHNSGMDIQAVAQEIRDYTSGYPYLVSRICECIEKELGRNWTKDGVLEAVKLILQEQSTLIDDLGKNILADKELSDLLYDITINGAAYKFSATDYAMGLGFTFGYLRNKNGKVVIDNTIFELIIYEHFITEKQRKGIRIDRVVSSDVVKGGKFDMKLCIERFARHYYELYRESSKKFLEEECRMLFLTYIRPVINGAGFYHIESETRNAERTDVIVDYGAEQFIVELKRWYGEAAHEEAYDQLCGYLESKNKDLGFLLTFDFRSEKNIGKPQSKWVEHKGKKIFDCMVGFG